MYTFIKSLLICFVLVGLAIPCQAHSSYRHKSSRGYSATKHSSKKSHRSSGQTIASFYTDEGNGRWRGQTSSGERFNVNAMTAAHMSLPFGTKVKVTNLKNDLSVVVKINDRGPARWTGFTIDLTKGAAKVIGLTKTGTAPVKIDVLN